MPYSHRQAKVSIFCQQNDKQTSPIRQQYVRSCPNLLNFYDDETEDFAFSPKKWLFGQDSKRLVDLTVFRVIYSPQDTSGWKSFNIERNK